MTHATTRPARPIDALGDSELIRGSMERPEQFEALFTRHVDAIFAFTCARVGPSHAEDVTAETFAAAFRGRGGFDLLAPSARPWLYGIAANTLRRHHEQEARWLRRAALDPASVPGDEEAASGDRIDARRLAPRLAAALADLSAGERDVLLLHVLGGLTHGQVAAALGIRRGTAKSRLSRGRARLRATLPDLIDDDGNRA